MVKPRTHCPAAYIPEVTICDPTELDPLISFLGKNERASEPTAFPRGTVLPDGRLDLCKQSIGPEGAARVTQALRGNRAITSVLFGTDAIGPAGVAAIGELVASRESALETIYLGCNRIVGEALGTLSVPLGESTTVKALWLKRNPLGPTGAEIVATLLDRNQHLEVLDLFNCELGDRGAATVIASATNLRALDVGGNGCGREAAKALATVLSQSALLEDLSLSANPLGDDGAELLASGLRANSSLKRLDVSSCAVGSRGAAVLSRALAEHPRIEFIDFSRKLAAVALGEVSNSISDKSADEICRLLEATKSLRSLDLRNAGITSRGALEIIATLEQQPQIAYLGLSRFVSRRIRRRIAALLERNRAAGSKIPPRPEYVSAIQSVYRNPPPE